MKHKPCNECPWRKDVPAGTWPAERFQNLAYTCQDDGMALMACHKSHEGNNVICTGFVVSMGMQSVGIRLAAHFGRIVPEDHVSEVPLYDSFEAMLEANDVEPPRPNRWEP